MANHPNRNKLYARQTAVDSVIREAVSHHLGEYKDAAVDLSLALQYVAQAMVTDDPSQHEACVRLAIDKLIEGGYLLEHPTVPMPVLEA